jgi:hypothetical protein
MTREEVRDRFVEECKDDHVGLWQLVNAVQLDLGVRDRQEIRNATLELVRDLLAKYHVRAGAPGPDWRNFVPWELTPAEAIARICQEWDALGKDPDIGDIAWFTTVD